MVLYRASILYSNGISKIALINITNIATRSNITRNNIFFEHCKSCQQEAMSAIPPSAFSSARIRESQQAMKVSNTKKGNEPFKYFNTKLTELTPMKYNSKLMNSIWGFYNRYSPHNVKKVNEAHPFTEDLQQTAANSSTKSEAKISLPAAKLDVWTTMSV